MSRTEPTMGLHVCSNVPNHLQASTQDNGRLRWAAPVPFLILWHSHTVMSPAQNLAELGISLVEDPAITGQIHFFPSIMCFSAHITSFECKYVSYGVCLDFIKCILSFPAWD